MLRGAPYPGSPAKARSATSTGMPSTLVWSRAMRHPRLSARRHTCELITVTAAHLRADPPRVASRAPHVAAAVVGPDPPVSATVPP